MTTTYTKTVTDLHKLTREVSAITRCSDHVGVVKLVGVERVGDVYKLSTLYAGTPLSRIINRYKLKEPTIRNYIIQLLEAVEHCHNRNIYHRDIKPDNIVVDNSHKLTLIDFGAARHNVDQLLQVELVTTPDPVTPDIYAAPECLRKQNTLPHKSDEWSIGVILYIMITCKSLIYLDQDPLTRLNEISEKGLELDKYTNDSELIVVCEGLLTQDPRNRITCADALILLGKTPEISTEYTVTLLPYTSGKVTMFHLSFLYEWMTKASHRLELSKASVVNAFNIVAKYVGSTEVEIENLSLVGIVSIYLSSTLFEVAIFEIDDHLHMVVNKFTKEQFDRVVYDILEKLNYNVDLL